MVWQRNLPRGSTDKTDSNDESVLQSSSQQPFVAGPGQCRESRPGFSLTAPEECAGLVPILQKETKASRGGVVCDGLAGTCQSQAMIRVHGIASLLSVGRGCDIRVRVHP